MVGTKGGRIMEYAAKWDQAKNSEKLVEIEHQMMKEGEERVRVISLSYLSSFQFLFSSFCSSTNNKTFFFVVFQRSNNKMAHNNNINNNNINNNGQRGEFIPIYSSLSDNLSSSLPFLFFVPSPPPLPPITANSISLPPLQHVKNNRNNKVNMEKERDEVMEEERGKEEKRMWAIQTTGREGKGKKEEEYSILSLFIIKDGAVEYTNKQIKRDGKVISFSSSPLLFPFIDDGDDGNDGGKRKKAIYLIGEKTSSSPSSSYLFLDFLPLSFSSSPSSTHSNDHHATRLLADDHHHTRLLADGDQEMMNIERIILRTLSSSLSKRGNHVIEMKVDWMMVENSEEYSLKVKTLMSNKYFEIVIKENGSALWSSKNISRAANLFAFDGPLLFPSLCYHLPHSPFARKHSLQLIKSFRRSFPSFDIPSYININNNNTNNTNNNNMYSLLQPYLISHYAISQGIEKSERKEGGGGVSFDLSSLSFPHPVDDHISKHQLNFSHEISLRIKRMELEYWVNVNNMMNISLLPPSSSPFLHRWWSSISPSLPFAFDLFLKSLNQSLTSTQLSSFLSLLYYLLLISDHPSYAGKGEGKAEGKGEEFAIAFNIPQPYQHLIKGMVLIDRGEMERSWEEVAQAGHFLTPFFFLLLRSYFPSHPFIALQFYQTFYPYLNQLLPSNPLPSHPLPSNPLSLTDEDHAMMNQIDGGGDDVIIDGGVGYDDEDEESERNVRVVFGIYVEHHLYDKALSYARSKAFNVRKGLMKKLFQVTTPKQLEHLGLFPIDPLDSHLFSLSSL